MYTYLIREHNYITHKFGVGPIVFPSGLVNLLKLMLSFVYIVI